MSDSIEKIPLSVVIDTLRIFPPQPAYSLEAANRLESMRSKLTELEQQLAVDKMRCEEYKKVSSMLNKTLLSLRDAQQEIKKQDAEIHDIRIHRIELEQEADSCKRLEASAVVKAGILQAKLTEQDKLLDECLDIFVSHGYESYHIVAKLRDRK